MPHITVLGGTGYAGSAIVAEAASRGHQVVAVARRRPAQDTPPTDADSGSAPEFVAGDARDETFLKQLVQRTDVVVVALAAREEMRDRVIEVVQTLVPLALETGARLGVIGGAGSLRVSPEGPRLIDTDQFPDPAKPEAEEMIRVLERLEGADASVDWFYVSPAAEFGAHSPTEPTGSYRADDSGVLPTGGDGGSQLAAEDLARAVVDEIETPAHHRQRFAVISASR